MSALSHALLTSQTFDVSASSTSLLTGTTKSTSCMALLPTACLPPPLAAFKMARPGRQASSVPRAICSSCTPPPMAGCCSIARLLRRRDPIWCSARPSSFEWS